MTTKGPSSPKVQEVKSARSRPALLPQAVGLSRGNPASTPHGGLPSPGPFLANGGDVFAPAPAAALPAA